MLDGTAYSRTVWTSRSPPPRLPPSKVACAMTTLTLSGVKCSVSVPTIAATRRA